MARPHCARPGLSPRWGTKTPQHYRVSEPALFINENGWIFSQAEEHKSTGRFRAEHVVDKSVFGHRRYIIAGICVKVET